MISLLSIVGVVQRQVPTKLELRAVAPGGPNGTLDSKQALSKSNKAALTKVRFILLIPKGTQPA